MVTKRRVLELLVDEYESAAEPPTASRLAARLAADPATVRGHLDALETYELVSRSATAGDGEPGFEPTVTGRELLALDIDDDALIVLDVEE
jgi:predicted ArsR family transcriptional regulator